MSPDLLTGLRFQGDDPISGRHVHHTINHDRSDLLKEFRWTRTLNEPILGMELIRPDLSQRPDGPGVNLI